MNAQTLIFVLAVLLLVFALFNAYKLINISRKRSASIDWPQTTAKVTARDISTTRNAKTRAISYRADIRYRYEAPGGPFDRKLFLGSKRVREQADQLLAAVADTFLVRYNPANPGEHISDHEKGSASQWLAVCGMLLLAAALVWLGLQSL